MNRRGFVKMLGLTPLLSWVGLIPKIAKGSEPSILELVDSGSFGDLKLFPAQRFVLKMMYGLDLDSDERRYLARLKKEGRAYVPRSSSKETVLVMGRRSGMTMLGQIVQLHEALKLVQSPGPGQERVLSLFTDKDSAGLGLSTFTSFTFSSALCPYVKDNTQSDANFGGLGGREVKASFKSSSAKGLRGIRASSVVLDNAAYYLDLAETLRIVRPYQGRITIPTSSNGSETFGNFYREAQQRGALVLRIPTWEANPYIPRSFFETEKKQLGTSQFNLEYGAEV
jgi:hypothetical protein